MIEVRFNKEKIISGEFYPYIKPTRRKHDSEFRIFEVGYCKLDQNSIRIIEKMVMGQCSDHIWFMDLPKDVDLNMDLTLDGYIRIWSHRTMLWGRFGDMVVSSADVRFEGGDD